LEIKMRFICLVHVDPSLMEGMTDADHKALNAKNYAEDQALLKSGHLIAAGPLGEPQTATLVRVRNGRLSMTDGAYVETKEHLGGFVLIEAESREQALELLAADNSMAQYGTLEIREHWALEAP
jgi:hypothetical protein